MEGADKNGVGPADTNEDGGNRTGSNGAHNDFLRALLVMGIIGLLIYLPLLFLTGLKLIQKCRDRLSPLNIAALMIYWMGWIDALGLVLGAYRAYQGFAWGFIGLALQGSIDADRDAMDLDKKPVKDGIRGFIGLQSGNSCV